MINTSELRIGNNVSERDNHRIYEVKNVLLNSVIVKYWSCGETEEIPSNRLMPIPLTSEILEGAGFILDSNGDTWRDNEVLFWSKEDCNITFSYWPFECCLHGEELEHIKYLHQLQNLFFATHGKKLEIKLTADAR